MFLKAMERARVRRKVSKFVKILQMYCDSICSTRIAQIKIYQGTCGNVQMLHLNIFDDNDFFSVKSPIGFLEQNWCPTINASYRTNKWYQCLSL